MTPTTMPKHARHRAASSGIENVFYPIFNDAALNSKTASNLNLPNNKTASKLGRHQTSVCRPAHAGVSQTQRTHTT